VSTSIFGERYAYTSNMPAGFTRVKLKNYRSIAAADVELQRFTLLVGPNGAGKSNFLDSLRFLVRTMHAPIEQVIEARSGMKSVLRKLPKGGISSSFSIAVEFTIEDGTTGSYSLTVGAGPDGAADIQSEECRVGKDRFAIRGGELSHSTLSAPAFTGDRPALVAFGAQPAFAPAFNIIAGMTFYSPNPEKMRQPTSGGPGKVLSRDASNAADVFARLQRDKPAVVERIRGYLESFNPEFKDVMVTETDNYRWLAFRPATNPSGWRLNSSDVSEGTLRAMGILLAIFQAGSGGNPISLVGLEEPENNLHPAAAGVLLDALLEASLSVPIIASTHSADMLDRKDLPESSLLAVALQDGETIIGPIDDSGKAILHKHLYTAGELMRSNQLTPNRTIGTPQ
jgi:predicted ATPase